MTEPNTTIHAALLAAQKMVKPVCKDGRNEFHGYDYASAAAVEAEARRVLHANGLYVSCSYEVVNPEAEKPVVICTMYLWSDIDREHSHPIITAMHAMDKGDKGIPKAQTGSRKYALMNLLAMASTDDPEADGAAVKGSTTSYIAQPATTPKPYNPPAPKPTTGDAQWYTLMCTRANIKETRTKKRVSGLCFDVTGEQNNLATELLQLNKITEYQGRDQLWASSFKWTEAFEIFGYSPDEYPGFADSPNIMVEVQLVANNGFINYIGIRPHTAQTPVSDYAPEDLGPPLDMDNAAWTPGD